MRYAISALVPALLLVMAVSPTPATAFTRPSFSGAGTSWNACYPIAEGVQVEFEGQVIDGDTNTWYLQVAVADPLEGPQCEMTGSVLSITAQRVAPYDPWICVDSGDGPGHYLFCISKTPYLLVPGLHEFLVCSEEVGGPPCRDGLAAAVVT